MYTQGCISIVPLLGWYDFSFGQPDAFLKRAWRDFRACRWPEEFDFAGEDLQFLSAQNDRYLSTDNARHQFFPFSPRLTMPAAIPEHRRKVYPVLGVRDLVTRSGNFSQRFMFTVTATSIRRSRLMAYAI